MHESLDQLEERLSEFRRLRGAGVVLGAVLRLAEISDFVSNTIERSALRAEWLRRIEDEMPDIGFLNAAANEWKERVSRLRRILSTGGHYTFEELILVITLRVEIELGQWFLKREGVRLPDIDLSDLDESIRSLARSSSERDQFSRARERARRNWGIELSSAWLSGSAP